MNTFKRLLSDRRLEQLARAGYAAKSVVYGAVALLALQAAWYGAQHTEGSRDAIEALSEAPFGDVLMLLLSLGLFAYAAYRGIQALVDPTHDHDSDTKGHLKRVGRGASALIHVALGIFTLSIATQWVSRGSSGGGTTGLTATVLAAPFGRVVVFCVGLGMAVAAFFQMKRAWKGDVFEGTERASLDRTSRVWLRRLGRLGFGARAVTFVLTAWFLASAAIDYAPSKAGGLGKALSEIAQETYGAVLLGVFAVGLIGYALYCAVKARYITLRT